MTPDWNSAKQKRRNKNRHYRSTLNPKVRKRIEFLRAGWTVMGGAERGQRINNLLSFGCSKRGLGRELGGSETSIRRYAEIAGLPESDRKAINSGASAKEILKQKATAALQRERRLRIDQDARTGALSSEIASIILEFCRTGSQLRKQPMIRAMFPTLLDNVGSFLRKFEQTDHRAPKAAKKFEPRELFWKTRPRLLKNTPAMVHQGEWLAEVLWLIAPESPIRERALIKARKRAGELLTKRTPIESFEDECFVSEAKSIERSNLSRKGIPGGARSMTRQGRASMRPDLEGPGNTDSMP